MFCVILGITGVDVSSEFALSVEKSSIILSHPVLGKREPLL